MFNPILYFSIDRENYIGGGEKMENKKFLNGEEYIVINRNTGEVNY